MKSKKIQLVDTSQLSSPLRWAGGKSFIAKEINTIFLNIECEDTLVEIFGGSLALTFAISPKTSVVNDILTPLTNLYSQIKSGELKSVTDHIDISNTKDNFIKNRQMFNDINRGSLSSSAKEAALFYYLNRTCFNGLCRFSAKTGFNVGWGKLVNPSLLFDFSDHKKALSRTTIHNESYDNFTFESVGLVIIDPPFYGTFTGYADGGFSLTDQQALSDKYKDTTNPLIAFNSDHPVILEIYRTNGFNIYTYEAPRKISSNGNRDSVREMFATKNIDHDLIMSVMRGKKIKFLGTSMAK